ncbi:uncharacterized protein BT62DRAFT_927493 [Guyanagaster necrorhizus]|uniref:DUF7702 domain-containing protein n=1 Tax=Guyanagaster necrorhizus TaxID=856835 RepID=A0A9P8AWC4_9AGAR|nr:uncharacterized protein BT62DRAFT_927493 [Guyanagaster necrorhizus MCA 3950]KAG7450185.1 hypothetical protein BT62DRAFT_927493 [Guyanagaster necrorhizus MCA 3950]
MASLNTRGQIAAAQLAFYVPLAAVSFFYFIRYLFRRDAGWLFLLTFTLMRIAGGALIVAGELTVDSSPNVDLFIAAYLLFHAGLSILMLATIGFLGLAGQHTYSEEPRVTRLFRFAGFIALIALALAIAGGLLGTHVNPDANAGMIVRRVEAGVYGALYLFLVFIAMVSWSHRYFMRSYRRRLLTGVTFALLLMGVRVAYEILTAWSASDVFGDQLSSNPTLAKFNPITGDWVLFLVMGLIMEYMAAIMFIIPAVMLHRRRH